MKSVETAIKILEALRDKWATQKQVLETGYDEDAAAMLNKAQGRIMEHCSNDLYNAIAEIKEVF